MLLQFADEALLASFPFCCAFPIHIWGVRTLGVDSPACPERRRRAFVKSFLINFCFWAAASLAAAQCGVCTHLVCALLYAAPVHVGLLEQQHRCSCSSNTEAAAAALQGQLLQQHGCCSLAFCASAASALLLQQTKLGGLLPLRVAP